MIELKTINGFATLINNGDIVMSNEPSYFEHMDVSKAFGNVLIGGWGMGLVAEIVANMPSVISVTVIDYDRDVIAFTQPMNQKITVIHDEFKRYIKSNNEHYDYCYFDNYYEQDDYTKKFVIDKQIELLKDKYPNIIIDYWWIR